MRRSSSSNRRVIRSQTTNQFHLRELQREEQSERWPSVPIITSQPPDPPAITLITSSLSVVQPVGLPPATPMVSFPSFDENPNQDPHAHIQSFSNAEVMSLVNDNCYAYFNFLRQ